MYKRQTAAAAGGVGQLRFDPMAMLPFCGYNMAEYFQHWLDIGETEGAQLPKIFYVNWFRKDDDGKFVWPGFGENSRVLEWVYNRCKGENETHDTSLGLLPYTEDLNLEGLDLTSDDIADILSVDDEAVKAQLPQVEEHLARFENLPSEIQAHLDKLKAELA